MTLIITLIIILRIILVNITFDNVQTKAIIKHPAPIFFLFILEFFS